MEIKIGETTFEDTLDKIINKNGKIRCACGGMLKMVGHWDGSEDVSTYYCECGNMIKILMKHDWIYK